MAEPKIRYISKTEEFHSGIPAHDLSAEDYDALDTDQRAIVRDSVLYDYAGYKDKVQAAKDAPAPAAPKAVEPPAAAPKDDKSA